VSGVCKCVVFECVLCVLIGFAMSVVLVEGGCKTTGVCVRAL
jgi:hypothetical protein